MPQKITSNKVFLVVGVVLVAVGLKLASAGVGAGHLFQSDGYNVSGAIIAAVGGFMLGQVWNRKKGK